jgi:ribose/xylose/arabinose/galactoside ABC-type transport system permease subunit
MVYTFSGFCAGVAGLIVSSNVKSADANNAGLTTELDAILAVVIGGTLMTGGRFSLMGSVIGALIIQTTTTTMYALGVPAMAATAVKALVVLIVILLYSEQVRVGMTKSLKRKGQGHNAEIKIDRKYIPVLATITLFFLGYFFGALQYKGMRQPSVFLNLLTDNAYLLISAIGETFVILTGGIDLSVGAVIALVSTASAYLLEKVGLLPEIVIPLMLLMGTGLGFIMGALIHYFKVQPFIATLGGMWFARGMCFFIS